MTTAVWTVRQPIVGVQQPDAVSDVQRHPLGTRMNAVSLGIEYKFIYGKSNATLAANDAATYDPATGLITAGTTSAIDGNVLAANVAGQYVWLKITTDA